MSMALDRQLLSLYPLRLTLTATEPLALDEHAGSSLRGALFGALLRRFCVNPTAESCAVCALNATCPVAGLVAPLRDERPHGRDAPRPFVLEAPAGTARVLEPGQSFTLGLTLIGAAVRFFPYVALAAQVMGAHGLGRPLAANGGRRGRFQVERIDLIDPFAPVGTPVGTPVGGDEYAVRQGLSSRGSPKVTTPALPITADDVAVRAASLPADRLALRFFSPMRLIDKGGLIRTPQLPILVARLAERLDTLTDEYGLWQFAEMAHRSAEPARDGGGCDGGGRDGGGELALPYTPSAEQRAQRRERARELAEEAACLRLVQDETRWVDVASYSARQGRATPIGGFVGAGVWRGDLSLALRELLVWGELLHVGKNAVKGDGKYGIAIADEPVAQHSGVASDAASDAAVEGGANAIVDGERETSVAASSERA